jgi:hypothetical protein
MHVKNTVARPRQNSYILNKSMTSSVDVKVSISGCTCRSMTSRRRGRILKGPTGMITKSN